jgi:AcrR family transcriptional regulator
MTSFRERKRQATFTRITAAAARLTLEQGLAVTTVDQIAEEAEVGRATFFRYFDTKERAVAEGFTGVWLQMILEALGRQAPDLSPLDAVRTAFEELASGFGSLREIALSQAQLSRSSPALNAWTLQVYASYEQTIAECVRARFADITSDDSRPRLVGALVMASIRLALDDWVAANGQTDLPALIDRNLSAVSIHSSYSPALASSEGENP